ncbi:MAG TPA: mechanosensitive ion channel family protein [Gemmatimonadales bacterium]|nr:mechanosensitive ion channel family protein [Gemmatimonadales bacterium]
MKLRDQLSLAALTLLLAATIGGYVTTDVSGGAQASGDAAPSGIIDRAPLQTAQRLAALATTPEETSLAREALRLGDHAIDLEFTIALLEAAEHPADTSASIRELNGRIQAASERVAEDRSRIARLTPGGAGADSVNAGLELAKAQLELHQGELADARDDLLRAGGDPVGRIREMVADHDSAQHAAAAAPKPAAARTDAAAAPGVDSAPITHTVPIGLIDKLAAWRDVRARQKLLRQAAQETTNGIGRLVAERQREAQHAAAADSAAPPATPAEALARTRHRAADQKVLAGLTQRIEDQVGLLDVYSRWSAATAVQARSALHDVFLGGAWLLLIVLLVFATVAWLDRLFARLSHDRRRLHTLRSVARFTVRALGLVAATLVLVGPPSQLATIIGLAGAGLTVVLKDFIVAFFGWFALMGRNGVRIGDWVEINGVSGEIVEITPFHTVLLETGNWTQAGHPTGRQVTFSNAFAIEGHFFNFSTSGQWLWDELEFVLPAGKGPAVVEAIRRIVTTETAENARLAEEEWSRANAARGVSEFSAEPAIDVRPGAGGIRVVARYITRANERHRLRTRLYQAVVDLLGQPPALAAAV